MPDAIDEILRMNAPLMSNRRVTTGDVEIGGRTIPAGEKITIVNLEAAALLAAIVNIISSSRWLRPRSGNGQLSLRMHE